MVERRLAFSVAASLIQAGEFIHSLGFSLFCTLPLSLCFPPFHRLRAVILDCDGKLSGLRCRRRVAGQFQSLSGAAFHQYRLFLGADS